MGAIVWLASYPKSGNTWLRAFITNYVLAGDEPLTFQRMNQITCTDLPQGGDLMGTARADEPFDDQGLNSPLPGPQ